MTVTHSRPLSMPKFLLEEIVLTNQKPKSSDNNLRLCAFSDSLGKELVQRYLQRNRKAGSKPVKELLNINAV